MLAVAGGCLSQFRLETQIAVHNRALCGLYHRAPWEAELAQHLPIPDKPVRELAHQMYTSPEEFDLLVRDRAREMLGDEPH